ncbi:MAG: hypothetical protein ACTHLR_00125 [Rhizomicrobium sp.]
MRSIAFVVVAALSLGGCMVFGGPRDRALRHTPDFRAGYSDGCAAATAQSANPRDRTDSLAGEPSTYRRGYASGYQSCRRGTLAPGSVPSTGLGNNVPTPGQQPY